MPKLLTTERYEYIKKWQERREELRDIQKLERDCTEEFIKSEELVKLVIAYKEGNLKVFHKYDRNNRYKEM